MKYPLYTIAALVLLVFGFIVQASLAGFLEWHGIMLHFFPALFFFLLPIFPRGSAITAAAASGALYDGLWGIYPGSYLVSYMIGALAVILIVRNIDAGRLPARFMAALSGLMIYAITAGAVFFLLKRSNIILTYIGWETSLQSILILLFTLIVGIYRRARYKPIIYG